MVTERQIKERELRKQNILDSALSVFKNKGFEGSTMDEIAKDADFGKATLYYYFNSKEEIFVEILNNGWKMIWESIEEEVHDHDQPKETFINSLNIIGGLFHGLFFLGNDKKQMSRETMEEFISTFIGNYSSD